MKPQPTFKLRIKIGDREFEAEGPPNFIQESLRDFQTMAGAAPAPREPGAAAVSGAIPEPPSENIASLEALVERDKDGEVRALQVVPAGRHREADAALLLLLAFKRLRGRDQVPVIPLKDALRRSGAAVERLDRTLARHLRQQLVVKTGSGKGGRYRLTQEGLVRADRLSQELRRLLPS